MLNFTRRFSYKNKIRAQICYNAFLDFRNSWEKLRQTYRNGYPVPVSEIETILRNADVKTGDNLHVHVSLENLLIGSRKNFNIKEKNPVQYAKSLLDMLFDVIGDNGTLTTSTDYSVKEINRSLIDGDNESFSFNYIRHPSTRGIFSELMRRRNGTERSVFLWKNLSVNGQLAPLFVENEDSLSTPYTMGPGSFWDTLANNGGKVVFLGNTNLGTNTFIHYFDNIYPNKLPTPAFYAKQVSVNCLNRKGEMMSREFIINAPTYTYNSVVNYCDYLDQNHNIYNSIPLHNDAKIIVYEIEKQLIAQKYEMEKNGLTWWHSKFQIGT